MNDKPYSISPLSILRFSKVNHHMEVHNSLADATVAVPYEELNDIKNVSKLIKEIKESFDDSNLDQQLYSHWLDRGWHKALDYYIESRDFTSIKDKIFINTVNASINFDIKNNFLQTLLHRRTHRVFLNTPLEFEILAKGTNLYFENNVTNSIDGVKFYYVLYNVKNMDNGVYYYNIPDETFDIMKKGNFRNEMSDILQGLRAPKMAAFSCIIVADFNVILEKMPYKKGLRDLYIETGRIAQKMLISYGSFNLACLTTPALKDKKVSTLLALNEPDCAPLYSLTFGIPLK